MLRSFRLSNHRSFRDEHELLLMPVYDKTGRSTVPVAAIYGANAAGKSNLLDGLRFMAEAVRDSYRLWHPEDGIPRHPFALAATAADQPSTFVAELLIDQVRHTYGFVIDDHRVSEEWLYAYPRTRRRVIFERDQSRLTFGSTVAGPRVKIELLTQLTRTNALFLSLAAQVGLPELLPIYHCFAGSPGLLRFTNGSAGRDLRHLTAAVTKLHDRGPERVQQLVDLLAAADLGITDIKIEREDTQQALVDQTVSLAAGRPGTEIVREPANGPARLWFAHGTNGARLDLADESAGTRAWLSLLPDLIGTLEQGCTLVIDELDTSLHPELVAQLVLLFQDDRTNPRGAQLIFTTHDTTLLGTAFGEDVLERDQIWFVEKDNAGVSRLYPLSDFHPRLEENRERRYLGGSYGAVPILSTTDLGAAARYSSEGVHGRAS